MRNYEKFGNILKKFESSGKIWFHGPMPTLENIWPLELTKVDLRTVSFDVPPQEVNISPNHLYSSSASSSWLLSSIMHNGNPGSDEKSRCLPETQWQSQWT